MRGTMLILLSREVLDGGFAALGAAFGGFSFGRCLMRILLHWGGA